MCTTTIVMSVASFSKQMASGFWGVSFMLTGRKGYGNAPTPDAAKAGLQGRV